MTTARQLISLRVAVGAPEERLVNLAERIRSAGAHHCAVVDGAGKFSGLIRLADVVGFTYAGNRILADLVSPVQPLVVRATEPAEALTELFRKHQLYEAVVLADTGEFAGVATAESVVEFLLAESARKDAALRQTDAKLVAATSAKDIFLNSLSHELRTPLNPILLLASQGAADRSLPDGVREQFEVIATQTLLEAQLIDALLELAGTIKGNIRLDAKLTDLGAVLHHTINDMRTLAALSGRELQEELDAGMALVMGDPVKLDQVFRSLIRTAFEATEPQGRVKITSRSDAAAKRITIAVSDDGRGMTEGELAHAFELFPQEDGAEEKRGTGRIGDIPARLTLARAIVLLHAGTVEVASAGLGKGTTFSVTLPLARAEGAGTGGEGR